jgi:ribosomal protein S13
VVLFRRKKKQKMQIFQRRLPPEVLVSVGLTLICGIGRRSAADLCWRVGIGVDCRVSDMSRSQMSEIRQWLEGREREAKLRFVEADRLGVASRVGFLLANSGSSVQPRSGSSAAASVVAQPSLGQAFLETNLRGEQGVKIGTAIASGSYRGQRHFLGLPCRGQRTHTNARSLRHGKTKKA